MVTKYSPLPPKDASVPTATPELKYAMLIACIEIALLAPKALEMMQ